MAIHEVTRLHNSENIECKAVSGHDSAGVKTISSDFIFKAI